MNRRPWRFTAVRKSRTTLTLSADSLKEAHRIARSRNVNLSTVIAEALAEGLRLQTAAERMPGRELSGHRRFDFQRIAGTDAERFAD